MNKKKRAIIIFLKYFDYKFETTIDKITTEIILDDLSSKVDFEIRLK
jgi:hypothetical protein